MTGALSFVQRSQHDQRILGSVRRQGGAHHRGEFGVGDVVRHPVMLHVDMHVLPGVGARGHDRRVFDAGRGAVIVQAGIDEAGRRTAVALTVVKARSSLIAVGSQQLLVIGFHRSQLVLLI